MNPNSLGPLLEGFTPSEWYQLLNRKSFFWATKDRLLRFLNAGPYRNFVHDVIKVDTGSIIERHLDCITLAPFNTGVSSFGPKHPRGVDTFLSIEDYPLGTTQHKEVIELAVDYSVSDIAECTISVEQWKGRALQQTVWRR